MDSSDYFMFPTVLVNEYFHIEILIKNNFISLSYYS